MEEWIALEANSIEPIKLIGAVYLGPYNLFLDELRRNSKTNIQKIHTALTRAISEAERVAHEYHTFYFSLINQIQDLEEDERKVQSYKFILHPTAQLYVPETRKDS